MTIDEKKSLKARIEDCATKLNFYAFNNTMRKSDRSKHIAREIQTLRDIAMSLDPKQLKLAEFL